MEQIGTRVMVRSEAIDSSKELHLLKRCRDLCNAPFKSCSFLLNLLSYFAKLLLETLEGRDVRSGPYSGFHTWGPFLVGSHSSCLCCHLLLFKARIWFVRIPTSLFAAHSSGYLLRNRLESLVLFSLTCGHRTVVMFC